VGFVACVLVCDMVLYMLYEVFDLVLLGGSAWSPNLCGVIVGCIDWECVMCILCVDFVWVTLVVSQGRRGKCGFCRGVC
jgi:hypothetical protein